MLVYFIPLFILAGLLLVFGALVLLGRFRGGKYMRPIVQALTKVPLLDRWLKKASRAALEKQNPDLASAIRKLERTGATRDPLAAQRAMSKLTPGAQGLPRRDRRAGDAGDDEPRRAAQAGEGQEERALAPAERANALDAELEEHAWQAPARRCEGLAKCGRRVFVHTLPVAAKDVRRLEPAETVRGRDPQNRVDPEPFSRSREVAERPERVGDDQYLALSPPDGDLVPPSVVDDQHWAKRRSGHCRERDAVERDSEPERDRRAVPRVAVEQLDDARGLAELADPEIHTLAVDGVEDPHLPVERDGVRAAPDQRGLRCDPPEPPLLLVAETNFHLRQPGPSCRGAAP